MTTVLYLLIAALVFFIIGYILAKAGCSTGERYLSETPVDPVTADDGSCEDEAIRQAETEAQQAEEARLAEAARLKEEEAAAKAEAEAAEAAKREAEEKAQKEAEEKAQKEAEEKAAAEEKAKVEAEAQKKTEKADKEAEEIQESAPKESTDKKEAQEKEETSTEEPAAAAPEGLLDAPRNGKKDNLTKIKGIGVKIDEALNSIGIYHFDQIAVWTEENMAWADRELAFPGRAKRDNWVGQAKLLAEGKETEFSKRVEKGEVASSKKA